MGLDNIELPPFLLQALYTNSLIEAAPIKVENKAAAETTIPFLGNNRSGIAIIVSNDAHLYLPDDQLNFLLGVLAACKFTMDDVAVINLHKNEGIGYKAIAEQLSSKKVMLFGVAPTEIGLPADFNPYQIEAYHHQHYLPAACLSVIQQDKAEKTKLWQCLQRLFSI